MSIKYKEGRCRKCGTNLKYDSIFHSSSHDLCKNCWKKENLTFQDTRVCEKCGKYLDSDSIIHPSTHKLCASCYYNNN